MSTIRQYSFILGIYLLYYFFVTVFEIQCRKTYPWHFFYFNIQPNKAMKTKLYFFFLQYGFICEHHSCLYNIKKYIYFIPVSHLSL